MRAGMTMKGICHAESEGVNPVRIGLPTPPNVTGKFATIKKLCHIKREYEIVPSTLRG